MVSVTILTGKPIHVGYFVFGVMLLFFGWDVATIGNSCLTAKVLSGKTQGVTHYTFILPGTV